jgi:predicted nucleic acid-binding protein
MSDADGLQFVDTNVLIYAHDRSADAKHQQAKALLAELWENRAGCLSIQVLQEFYVNVTQKIARPLQPQDAAQIIADLSVWQVHQPAVEDVLDAIRLQTRYHLAFWDAMLLASAIALGCTVVWTEDLNTGQLYDKVRVSNPFVPAARR